MIPERERQTPDQQRPVHTQQSGVEKSTSPVGPAVPRSLPNQPGIMPGSVDITGIIPEGIRVDPDLTEGHPGYEESGDSEVILHERLRGGRVGQAEQPDTGKQ